MTLGITMSFWGCVNVEVLAVVTVIVGGRSRGAGTGGTAPAVVAAGTATGGGWAPLARLPVRMLHRLSEELLHPDWLLASLPRSCSSRYVSWADSVLLCSVTEMSGLEVVRGGTGGKARLRLPVGRGSDKEISA